MKWIKKGLIFKPEGQFDWMQTHAQCPVADKIGEDLYRIYFSSRDKLNRSRIGYVEIDIREPKKILQLSEKPVLDLGRLGCFDDMGVTPTCLVNIRDTRWKCLYYLGWNRGYTVAEVTGLAFSDDTGLTFHRGSEAPILDRTREEPFLILVISSIWEDRTGYWQMWYDGCDRWTDEHLPKYNIKHAVSCNGIDWVRDGIVSIDYKYLGESRISRACVLQENGIYKMWYCYAIGSQGYRMGYAESEDGVEFDRKDGLVGIDISGEGWDSEMICYPFVFNHKGKKYMLYNGNHYGETGFGLAELEECINDK